MHTVLLLMLSFFTTLDATASYSSKFFEERYRGWLWFEEKREDKEIQRTQSQDSTQITPGEAQAEIEQFAKELEELKFVMLARPTPESVRAYREKEKQMWQKAEELHDAWDTANLLYPEQRDLINNPVNVHGVKAKRELTRRENEEIIKGFAKAFDLVFFFSSSCHYCELFSPVLKSFGEKYGFNIEAVSNDHSKHQYFKTLPAQELINRLGITEFPTVIAVSHDSNTAFELIRGYVSISELEDYSLLAVKYLASSKERESLQ